MQTAICFVLELHHLGFLCRLNLQSVFTSSSIQKTIRWSLDIFVKIKRQKDLLAQRTSRVVTSCNMLLKLSFDSLPFSHHRSIFVFVLIFLKRCKSKNQSPSQLHNFPSFFSWISNFITYFKVLCARLKADIWRFFFSFCFNEINYIKRCLIITSKKLFFSFL